MENEIDFCQVVLMMAMIAGLRDCCWMRSGSRPLDPQVALLPYAVRKGTSAPPFELSRSHTGLGWVRFVLVLLRPQPDSALDGARSGSGGSWGVLGVRDAVAMLPSLGE
jgi:hypothetical protein